LAGLSLWGLLQSEMVARGRGFMQDAVG